MAAYLGLWGLISFILFIGTLRLNRALQIVFFLLSVAFALLALGDLTGNALLTKLGGWEGMVLGFAAMYTGLAQVLNEVYGRVIWPLGPVQKSVRQPIKRTIAAVHGKRGGAQLDETAPDARCRI